MDKVERIPREGERVNLEDVEMILEAVRQRKENFPDEAGVLLFALVLLNIGDRFTPVTCVHGEWSGLKKDIPKGEGLPTCPEGHPLRQGEGLTLGWIKGI